jgi:uncharacterized protein
MITTIERRAIDLEIRAQGRRLEGYAAVFGVETKIPGGVTESIALGAFARSIRGSDVLALVDHDLTKLLARTRSGTLRLAEDKRGLAFDLDLPATSIGNDVLALAERGDLGGMSFGFRVSKDGQSWDNKGTKRTLRSVDLKEISVISSWPAYENTVVNARSAPRFVRVELARYYLETLR